MSNHQMYDFPDTPAGASASRGIVLETVIEGLQRVLRGEHSHDEQERIIKNAAMLLKEMVEWA